MSCLPWVCVVALLLGPWFLCVQILTREVHWHQHRAPVSQPSGWLTGSRAGRVRHGALTAHAANTKAPAWAGASVFVSEQSSSDWSQVIPIRSCVQHVWVCFCYGVSDACAKSRASHWWLGSVEHVAVGRQSVSPVSGMGWSRSIGTRISPGHPSVKHEMPRGMLA